MSRHSWSNLLVHLVWATKYRNPILDPVDDAWLVTQMRRTALAAEVPLLAVGAAIDHVHLLITRRETRRLCDVVYALKGAVSRERNRQLHDAALLHWQDGYWAESVGTSALASVQAYVRGQRVHHATHGEPEPWEQWMRVVSPTRRR